MKIIIIISVLFLFSCNRNTFVLHDYSSLHNEKSRLKYVELQLNYSSELKISKPDTTDSIGSFVELKTILLDTQYQIIHKFVSPNDRHMLQSDSLFLLGYKFSIQSTLNIKIGAAYIEKAFFFKNNENKYLLFYISDKSGAIDNNEIHVLLFDISNSYSVKVIPLPSSYAISLLLISSPDFLGKFSTDTNFIYMCIQSSDSIIAYKIDQDTLLATPFFYKIKGYSIDGFPIIDSDKSRWFFALDINEKRKNQIYNRDSSVLYINRGLNSD
jgi:hypothetical protein